MSLRSRVRAALPFACAALCIIATTLVAEAAALRPNGIDHRVDALPDAMLLARPAAALVDGARQAAAARLEHWLVPGFLISILAQVLALAYFWQSGAAARLRDALRRAVRDEFVVRFLFGCSLAFVARAAAFVPEFYRYRIERAWSLTAQLLHAWSAQYAINTLVSMLVAGIVVAVVLWLVDRTHQWYIYTTVAIFAASIGIAYLNPLLIAPRVDRFVPLPAAVQRVADRLEARAHVGAPMLEQLHIGAHRDASYVLGFGSSTSIAVGDVLIAVASPRELAFDLGNELGYVAMNLAWRVAFADALFLIIGAALAVTIADRIGFRRDDDPVSRLALVGALLGLIYLAVVPIDNAMLARMSLAADRYAVALTGDRASAVRSIVRDTDENLKEVCPDVFARLFMSDTASPAERVAAINGLPSTCP
ncbi:MAG: M48 family metalloprotease [bacterium]|nr:M48 family metalloprotease [bacterium]